MLRKILLVGVAFVGGYVIGVRSGFDAGVRDHLENGGKLLEKVAAEKDKFDYPTDGDSEEESVEEVVEKLGFQ